MRARLRKKTLKVSMAQLLPRTLYLTTKVVGVSAFADAGTHPRIYLWPRSFLQLQIHAISVTLDYQLLDSHLWQTPLFYSMTIMSIINIGLQGLVYLFGETKCYFSICGTVPKVQFEDSVLEALLMLINLSGLKNLLSL
ncbi:uncharacterized protein LOC108344256 isoform X4 [Vigna angularis]|uniref:uncharacterized protein LOC108344256 isoform X4 n=1 Tax=Phaseolus angularis TaxID=3914 RepID=UPI0022B2DBC8|nr:uncharacterized protein LOC108344256 isoform X4 [Vigna angularis]